MFDKPTGKQILAKENKWMTREIRIEKAGGKCYNVIEARRDRALNDEIILEIMS